MAFGSSFFASVQDVQAISKRFEGSISIAAGPLPQESKAVFKARNSIELQLLLLVSSSYYEAFYLT